MSKRFPVCNARQVTRVLGRCGFTLIGQRGSHQKWRHSDGRQVIVPCHASKPLPIGTLKSIIEGASLSVEEFR